MHPSPHITTHAGAGTHHYHPLVVALAAAPGMRSLSPFLGSKQCGCAFAGARGGRTLLSIKTGAMGLGASLFRSRILARHHARLLLRWWATATSWHCPPRLRHGATHTACTRMRCYTAKPVDCSACARPPPHTAKSGTYRVQPRPPPHPTPTYLPTYQADPHPSARPYDLEELRCPAQEGPNEHADRGIRARLVLHRRL